MPEIVAEEATGLNQNPRGIGKYYAGPINRKGRVSDPGHEVTPEEALDHMWEGGSVGVPNAGAGSYKEFFRSLGFVEIKVIEWSSSAGDWSFGIKDKDGNWIVAFQENRHPRCGFLYSVQPQHYAASFETLCESLPK